jgi:membrane protein implicated in regulation of membrane protease activity
MLAATKKVRNIKEGITMKVFFIFVVLLSAGIMIAGGIAWLVGLIFPSIKLWVFTIVSLWWLYTGWKYAIIRDKMAKRQFSSIEDKNC